MMHSICSPQQVHLALRKNTIVAYEESPVRIRLSNQEAIKGIFMMQW